MDLLRRYMILQYYYQMMMNGESKMDAYDSIKTVYSYSHSTITEWVREFGENHKLKPSQKGSHQK